MKQGLRIAALISSATERALEFACKRFLQQTLVRGFIPKQAGHLTRC
jgi:hypothetical protein